MEAFEETELCFPQLLNSSCRRTVRPPSVSIIIYITLSSISVLTVALNLLVIISISHFKQLHTPTNILLLSLAVSDFFVGFIMCFQILIINGCWFLSDLMCSVYVVLDCIITSVSIVTMVLISVDRYIAICDPLHYTTRVTGNRVKVGETLCWLSSALYYTLTLKESLKYPGKFKSCIGECVTSWDIISGIVNLFLNFIAPVTIIFILYMRVFIVAVSQARAMRCHVGNAAHHGSVKVTANKSELKAARTLGVLVIVFLLCLCPYYCVSITGNNTDFSASSLNPWHASVLCLYYFNSCLNPLIYALFYPWFRKSTKLIVTLQILKPGSCKVNIM